MDPSRTNWDNRILMPSEDKYEKINSDTFRVCFCVGPKKGEPLCPCKMQKVQIRNGRYIIPEQDLGPVVVEMVDENTTNDSSSRNA